jgi:hypothetical protein
MNVNAKIRGQKDIQGQKDKYRDRDILYHRMKLQIARANLACSIGEFGSLLTLSMLMSISKVNLVEASSYKDADIP